MAVDRIPRGLTAAAGDGETKRLAARDLVLLRLLYASGARVSEICGLFSADCVAQR
jgi:site-specific recombinase XerD